MHIGMEWKRESKKIEKIKSKLQKVEKLCHFTMYENELEPSSVRGLCVKHVRLGREKTWMYLQARIHCWLNFTNKCTHWKGFHFFFISIFLIADIICIGKFFFLRTTSACLCYLIAKIIVFAISKIVFMCQPGFLSYTHTYSQKG